MLNNWARVALITTSSLLLLNANSHAAPTLTTPSAPEYVFRGDRRSPVEIKEAGGFIPFRKPSTDGAFSLYNHEKDEAENHDSVYVSTSQKFGVAAIYAAREPPARERPRGWVYRIKTTPNMISLPESMGIHDDGAEEAEYAAMSGIRPDQIIDWFEIPEDFVADEHGLGNMDNTDYKERAHEFEKNPDYQEEKYRHATASPYQPQLAGFPKGHRARREEPWSQYQTNSLAEYAAKFLDSIGAPNGWVKSYPLFERVQQPPPVPTKKGNKQIINESILDELKENVPPLLPVKKGQKISNKSALEDSKENEPPIISNDSALDDLEGDRLPPPLPVKKGKKILSNSALDELHMNGPDAMSVKKGKVNSNQSAQEEFDADTANQSIVPEDISNQSAREVPETDMPPPLPVKKGKKISNQSVQEGPAADPQSFSPGAAEAESSNGSILEEISNELTQDELEADRPPLLPVKKGKKLSNQSAQQGPVADSLFESPSATGAELSNDSVQQEVSNESIENGKKTDVLNLPVENGKKMLDLLTPEGAGAEPQSSLPAAEKGEVSNDSAQQDLSNDAKQNIKKEDGIQSPAKNIKGLSIHSGQQQPAAGPQPLPRPVAETPSAQQETSYSMPGQQKVTKPPQWSVMERKGKEMSDQSLQEEFEAKLRSHSAPAKTGEKTANPSLQDASPEQIEFSLLPGQKTGVLSDKFKYETLPEAEMPATLPANGVKTLSSTAKTAKTAQKAKHGQALDDRVKPQPIPIPTEDHLKFVFRGDYLWPAEVKKQGGFLPASQFKEAGHQPPDGAFSLANHLAAEKAQEQQESVFVSTSENFGTAARWAAESTRKLLGKEHSGVVYVIAATRNMVDISQTVQDYKTPEEREVVAVAGIRWPEVKGWLQLPPDFDAPHVEELPSMEEVEKHIRLQTPLKVRFQHNPQYDKKYEQGMGKVVGHPELTDPDPQTCKERVYKFMDSNGEEVGWNGDFPLIDTPHRITAAVSAAAKTKNEVQLPHADASPGFFSRAWSTIKQHPLVAAVGLGVTLPVLNLIPVFGEAADVAEAGLIGSALAEGGGLVAGGAEVAEGVGAVGATVSGAGAVDTAAVGTFSTASELPASIVGDGEFEIGISDPVMEEGVQGETVIDDADFPQVPEEEPGAGEAEAPAQGQEDLKYPEIPNHEPGAEHLEAPAQQAGGGIKYPEIPTHEPGIEYPEIPTHEPGGSMSVPRVGMVKVTA